MSPVAWTHINFYGRYVFTETPNAVPVDDVVETMARYSFRAHVEEAEEIEKREEIAA